MFGTREATRSGPRWIVRESGEHPFAEQSCQGERREALGTLTGGIIHDFNNLVAGMIGHAERAMDGLPWDSTAWQALQDVLGTGTRAKDLLRKILLLPRQNEPERNPVALHLVIQEAYASYR